MGDQAPWARVPKSVRDRLRAQVFARDGYRCQIRGPRCKGVAEDLDHIVEVAQGGALLDPMNLRASCQTCNRGRRTPRAKWKGVPMIVGPSREW